MKKQIVTNEVPKNVITLDVVMIAENAGYISDSYYGVEMSPTSRGFITREIYGEGKYAVRSPSNLTNGNGWDGYDSDTLRGLFENVLETKKVYRFDNFKELMLWVAEKC